MAKTTEGGYCRNSKPAPRKELVTLVSKILKEKQYRYIRKHVERISITTTVTGGTHKLGEWDGLKESIKIYDDHSNNMEAYEDVIRHEFAHGEYFYLNKWNPEARLRFSQLAEKHDPVSTYTRDHETSFRKYIITGGDWNLYGDEQHSELALILAGKMTLHKPFKTPSDELVQAYKELHFL